MSASPPDRWTLVAFTASILIGGTNFVAVRFSNFELPPLWGAGMRFLGAALLLLLYAIARRVPIPQGRAALGATLYGTLNFAGGYAFAYLSLVSLSAGLGSIVVALVPLLTLLLAAAQRQERMRWHGVGGALLAVAGIALISWGRIGGGVDLGPLLLMLGAAFCFAETAVVVKAFPRTHPVALNAVAMGLGGALLILLSGLFGERPQLPAAPATWLAVGYLVVVGSIGLFVLYVWVLGRWTASASSYGFVLTPLVAIPLGALLASEAVSLSYLAGGALVLVGVWFGALSRPKAGTGAVPAGPSYPTDRPAGTEAPAPASPSVEPAPPGPPGRDRD